MMFGAEFWVAVAFVLFFVLLGYFGVHKQILAMLDGRGKKVADDLAEAARYRDEAQKLLAEYQAKHAKAEAEAASIVEQAKADAERLKNEAEEKLAAFIARRTAMAESKIAQAEAQAMSDVRSAAVDQAITAASSIMAKRGGSEDSFAATLKEVKAHIH